MLVVAGLSGCAWNPVVTPYAYGGAANAPATATATVWGIADGTEMYFLEIDGKGLPSRGGGGYPISLSLLPGTYAIEVLFQNSDHRYAELELRARVAAGHTYVVEHEIIAANQIVALQLKDLGTDVTCQYERYNQVKGNARLLCR
jgi:hypothetical protein